MPTQQTRSITSTLTEELEVHEQWTDDYRTVENEAFFETAYDRIAKLLAAPTGASILDAGCGNGRHSARLAKRGFQVTAVDFSDSILSAATSHLHREGCEDRVTLQREDLLNLSFPDASFDNALCWGVLMHVHEAELAARNIGRVVKPGGRFVISEGNMHSWQARGFETLRRLANKGDAVKVSGNLGMEYWTETTAGKLLTREANIPNLIKVLDENGFALEHRIPGQLTEAYTRMPQGVMRTATHWLNRIWFNYVRWAGPAFGNVLVFRKR